MELNFNRTFKEKLEDIILDDILNKEFLKKHLLVFEIEDIDKRKLFHNILQKAKWIKFDIEIHEIEDEFNYVYFYSNYFDKKGLYDIFQKFNGKTIVFDNETILKKQSLIDIMEGAICSSPDSGTKWPIRLDGQKEFKFNGSVIILTNQERVKFCKTKKYQYLTRDMIKV